MDTVLIKTFLEVVACNSFAGAAEKLFVSQSAVSLRIKALEGHLGRTLFTRSKAGVKLTSAGRRLIRYAYSFLLVWEEARQQVAVPEKYEDVLTIAGEQGLWERLLIRWLPDLAERLPKMAFRAEAGKSNSVMRQMAEGTIDIAVLYMPQIRPDIEVKKLFDEFIVLVSTDSDSHGLDEHYIFNDWGEEFTAFHSRIFPDYDHARITFKLGQVTLNYLLNNGGSAFVPLRLAMPFIEKEKLYLVEHVPHFIFPVNVAWRSQIDRNILNVVMDSLETISTRSVNNQLPAPHWAT